MTIYKYPIIGSGVIPQIKIEMPHAAEILSAGFDPNERLCIWAKVDPNEEAVYKTIYCIGTGWPLDEIFEGKYNRFIDTVKSGPYMWHIFEGEEERDIE